MTYKACSHIFSSLTKDMDYLKKFRFAGPHTLGFDSPWVPRHQELLPTRPITDCPSPYRPYIHVAQRPFSWPKQVLSKYQWNLSHQKRAGGVRNAGTGKIVESRHVKYEIRKSNISPIFKRMSISWGHFHITPFSHHANSHPLNSTGPTSWHASRSCQSRSCSGWLDEKYNLSWDFDSQGW